MKKLEKKQDFIYNTLLQLFGIYPNEAIKLVITKNKIDEINKIIPKIKQIFVTKEFYFHKMNNKISTSKQAITILCKCLKQAKIDFSYKNDIFILTPQNEIKSTIFNVFDEKQITVNTSNIKLFIKQDSSVTLSTDFILAPEQIISIKVLNNINLLYELNYNYTKIIPKRKIIVNENLFFDTIIPYSLTKNKISITFFSESTNIIDLEVTYGIINKDYCNILENGNYFFFDEKTNLLFYLNNKNSDSFIYNKQIKPNKIVSQKNLNISYSKDILNKTDYILQGLLYNIDIIYLSNSIKKNITNYLICHNKVYINITSHLSNYRSFFINKISFSHKLDNIIYIKDDKPITTYQKNKNLFFENNGFLEIKYSDYIIKLDIINTSILQNLVINYHLLYINNNLKKNFILQDLITITMLQNSLKT